MKNILNTLGIRFKKYEFKMPKEYKLKQQMLSSDNWRIGEEWGNVQDNANCFFQVEGDENNNTVEYTNKFIDLKVKPQEFYSTKINKQLHFKAGKIVSLQKFQYGIFKIRAKSPNLKYLWWAIWLCGKVQPENNIWQEVDIVESYNHDKVKFASSNKIYSQPNIHYFGRDNKHRSTQPGSKYVKHPHDRFVEYTLWWEKDFIRIYYDNYLVYECIDEFILDQFNEPMNLIINNAVEWGVELTKEDIKEISKADTTFCISSVEFYNKK